MANIERLQTLNTIRWHNAVVTADLGTVPARLVAAKAEYLKVQAATSVPWWVVALIHERECDQNWMLSLAQGDPWNRRSIHVPAGRGPFASWRLAAIDALENCEPFLARKSWSSIGESLTNLEEYNGLGYADGPVSVKDGVETHYAPQPSPYLWSMTNQYKQGKYIADHVYSPTAIDRQMGCAAILREMAKLDPSIVLEDIPAKPTVVATAAPKSWFSQIAGWFTGGKA